MLVAVEMVRIRIVALNDGLREDTKLKQEKPENKLSFVITSPPSSSPLEARSMTDVSWNEGASL